MLTEAFVMWENENEPSVCGVFKEGTATKKEKKDAPASLHSGHFRSGCSVPGDSSEQGDPDRNNMINQTRLSLKSLFLWVANLFPRGHQLTSW